MNLFNIKAEYARIMGMIEEAEGEVTDNIQEALEQITDNKEELLESLLNQIHQERYNQSIIKAELERIRSFKESSEKREERIKKSIIDILQFFDMRSTTKSSKGFAYKGPTNSCFTSNRESLTIDEFLIAERFAPIIGETSKLIEYTVNTKVDSDKLKSINDTGLFPISAYGLSINKKAITDYLKETRSGKQLEFGEDNEIKLDPIVDYVELVTNTSLTVK